IQELCRRAGRIPSEQRRDVWRLLLLGNVVGAVGGDGAGNGGGNAHGSRLLEEAIMTTALDLENQRVVRVDVERTRRDLPQFHNESVRDLLTRILVYHCKQAGVGYKQGMHEVLAPFVALSNPPMPVPDIFLCYSAFLERFLPYAFNKDDDFVSLQICFRLFRLLLLYHHPRLCKFLDRGDMTPELFATPWFLTLFAVNVDLDTLYALWDLYLCGAVGDGDGALHHFSVLAFVIGNADYIMESDVASLPERMCNLPRGFESPAALAALVDRARQLMANTPRSFRQILRNALYSHLEKAQLDLVLQTLQMSSCIPISAEEVTSYVLHRHPFRYLDGATGGTGSGTTGGGGGARSSGSGGTGSSGGGGSGAGSGGSGCGGGTRLGTSVARVAEAQRARASRVHRQYVILDCRSRDAFERCHLAPALHLDPAVLLLDQRQQAAANAAKLRELLPLRGLAHVCFVGEGPGGSARSRRSTHDGMEPSDLSGEAMGLRSRRGGNADAGGLGGYTPGGGGGGAFNGRSISGGGGGGGGSNGGGGGGASEGGRFELAGMLRSLLGQGDDEAPPAAAVAPLGAGKGEREEDERVSHFAQLLLDADFPYVCHIRGDMPACLQASS
ncbi:unnamed protein product, partial [Phaeothamnion confervicola]